MILKSCLFCKEIYLAKRNCSIFCSRGCAHKNLVGRKLSPEHANHCRTVNIGRKASEELRSKLSESQKRIGNKPPTPSGKNHYRWIKDRTKVIGKHNRNWHDPEYKQWVKKVYARDNFRCRMDNSDCKGRIEAHHILGWKSYPELRYQINNGITLCHAHHPRSREDEAKLSPYFNSLVASLDQYR